MIVVRNMLIFLFDLVLNSNGIADLDAFLKEPVSASLVCYFVCLWATLLFFSILTAPPKRTFMSMSSKRAVTYTNVSNGKFVSALVRVELRSVKRPLDMETTMTLNRYIPEAKTERWK